MITHSKEQTATSEESLSPNVRVSDEQYGCRTCRPKFLQVFNGIRWHVFWQCVFNFFEGFIVNGVINVIIPSLEKRYEMSSSRSSIIASSNDVGALIVLIFISYYGGQRNKPRIMAAGVFLMSVGSLIFSLPQFLGDKYIYTASGGTNGTQNFCIKESSEKSSNACQEGISDNFAYNGYYACFLIGQALLGIGAVPMYTIGLTYIDDNCKPKLTSFYLGCTMCSAAVGVAVGYMVGGQTLSYFVDADKVDPSIIPLTPVDPQWVGAWWIGILIAFFSFLLIAFPLLGYPQQLPATNEHITSLLSKSIHNGGDDETTTRPNFGKSWRDFPRFFFLLIKNPAFLCVCLASTTEALFVGGLATFGSKLLQEMYHVDLTSAGFIMGLITIPGSGGGMFLGGYLVKKFSMDFKGIVRFSGICMFVCMLFAPSFLAGCPSRPLAGITGNYKFESAKTGLTSDCNQDCYCTTARYEPVCDGNHTVYFTPCHAGCTAVNVNGDVKEYFNCSCITGGLSALSSEKLRSDAIGGSCIDQCPWFYVFCVLLLFIMLFTFMTIPAITTSTFRCVASQQRSLALGVQLLVTRLLGTTPGPILLGTIIDSACSVWQESCGQIGSCWTYRKYELSMRLMVWMATLKFLGAIFTLIAYKMYVSPPNEDNFDGISKRSVTPTRC
ncbi:solute carrier organic anion transporter family member 4A1-like [Mizuhopecten yessoensis]|uniref:solute carrier organic anion transporter family member 4A1-like n=1 Tax=Mizuhopecten yessoensis TaxID=6573 RepID=UPI000B457612|nr:solute carrier organic anion transporter family member 4A1-like [Mizuhopecten yessoensis]XP_021348126.1 solute carrier organic anion transporter family member 4A1-like [Mizuhopecten yessoensis]XP_021348127.1 solute carrier organic anion transporter family member 4A1-like [Mizuhopecten yessoensis]